MNSLNIYISITSENGKNNKIFKANQMFINNVIFLSLYNSQFAYKLGLAGFPSPMLMSTFGFSPSRASR